MLQAINRGKSNIYRRYLGYRDHSEHRVHEEDELTALLLGPLAFLPENLSAAFWGTLLIERKVSLFPQNMPILAHLSFWPSRSGKGGRVEPDLQVDLEWSSGQKCLLLVELKWRASLSGDNQLHRQWQEYLEEEERQQAFHLFIAPETSEALKARDSEQGDVWQGRLLAISWFDILSLLHNMMRKSDANFLALRPWMREVIDLLDKLGIRPFKGFNGLRNLSEPPVNQSVLFWSGFTGFEYLPIGHQIIQKSLLFFNN